MVAVSRKGPDPPLVKVEYETLHALLERVYVKLGERMVHGPAWRTAWDKAREAGCTRSGWTVDEFYAEMDARRATRR